MPARGRARMAALTTPELYVLRPRGAEWEDLTLFTSLPEALAACAAERNCSVEVFAQRTAGVVGYQPTYHFYFAGKRYDGNVTPPRECPAAPTQR